MICSRRLLFAATWLLATIGCAAELKHDLYVCANLSPQGGGVMGRGGPVRSGLFRSEDRETFTHLGPHHIRTFSVTHDPSDPARLYIALLDGILRTPDRGQTFRIVTSWDMTEAKSISVDPHRPEHVYAGIPDGIAVSHDRGQTWTRMNAGIRRAYTESILVDRTKAGRVLAGTELGIYLSEDGARTWRLVQATDKVTYALRQSPHDPRVFLATTASNGAFRSTDRGLTWQRLPSVPGDRTLHNIEFDPRQPRRLAYCGWGVGVQISQDDGATWQDRTAGLPKREIWRIAIDPDLPDRLYAGPYQEALYASDDFGRTWRALTMGRGTFFDLVFIPRK
ncbi:MAG: YCF48-related protein [Opitutaceae bacterium]|nr:YCF48-related protein [Opitutaceae bacterium]